MRSDWEQLTVTLVIARLAFKTNILRDVAISSAVADARSALLLLSAQGWIVRSYTVSGRRITDSVLANVLNIGARRGFDAPANARLASCICDALVTYGARRAIVDVLKHALPGGWVARARCVTVRRGTQFLPYPNTRTTSTLELLVAKVALTSAG